MALEIYETVIGINIAGNYAALVQHWGADITGGETPFEIAKDIVSVALQNAPVDPSFFDVLTAVMADDCFISSARARRVTGTGGASYVKPYAAADWPGAFGGDVDGAQVAAFVMGYTDGGAGLFAKNWIPGISEDALLDGRFTLTFKNAIDDYLDRWMAGLEGTTYTYLPYLKHGSPASYNRIVSAMLGATPGTIRRRLVPI